MSLKKKKEEEFSVANSIINGTWDDGSLNVSTPQTQSVANTVNTLDTVSNNIKKAKTTTMSFDDDKKEDKNTFSFSIDNKKEETPEEERKRKIKEYNEKVAKMNGYKSTEDYNYAKAKEKYEKSSEKVKEYEKEKGYNWLKNIFTGDNENDKKYKKLIEEETKNREAFNQLKVEKNTEKTKKELEENKNIGGTIAKLGISSAENFTRGVGGIESTARKITGQINEEERQKYDLFDPMYNAASETASKPEQVAMNIVGSWSQMIPQMIAPGSKAATAVGFANYGGSAYNDAKKDGATENQATMYGIASGSTEMLMEKLLGGFENIYGKSALGSSSKSFVNNVMTKFIKNEAVRKTLSGMKGEFTEEYLQEFLEPILKNIILEEDNGADFWNTMKVDAKAGIKQLAHQLFNQQNLEAGLQGMASSGLLQGPQNFAIQNQANQYGMTMDQYMDAVQKGQLQQTPVQEDAISQIQPLEQVVRDNLSQETLQNISQMTEQPQIPTQTPINTLSSNIQEQNNQILGQQQTPQITPLNQVNQELQETRQNDIANQVQAMNLETSQKISLEKQLENKASKIIEDAINTEDGMINNFKNYIDENDITNPTQKDIDDSLVDILGYDNEMTPSEKQELESNYNKVINEYLSKQENKTTQEEKPQEMPKNEVKQEVKKSYLTSAEQNELDGLRDLDNSGLLDENDSDYKRLQELEKKSQGITKKFPELKTKNTFDDIKSIYGKYKNSEISRENNKVLNEAKNIVEANKQGRRTIEEWKQIAEYIGSNADIKNSQDLQKLAMETWLASKPNVKENLNRQGKKYVKFGVDDWVNAVYKGAGVGTEVKLSQEERNTINESKQDDVVMMSAKDITNTLNDTKKGIVPDGKKMRRWVETSNTATGMEDSINKADIDKITYEVQSNKKTYDQAVANTKNMSYEQKVFNAQNKLNTNKKITPTDLAEAQLALREAATSGDMQTYLNLQQDIAIMGTELGQLVQSLSMIQKLSPDGQLMMLQKIVNRQQKLGNKNWDGVEFKEELVKKVLDSYDDNTHTTFNKEKMDKAVDDLKQDLADQMKVGISDKINEWRYLSMLGNPKTHIRNVVANVAMTITKRTKEKINAGLQDLIIRDPSKKTATLKKASKEVKELSKQAYEETFEVNQGNKYNEKNEIENKRQIFKTKPIETLRKVNAKALDLEDQAFKKLEFQRAFSNYLTAQNIKTTQDIETHPEIIQQAKAFALEESKIATFQQDNEFANWINKLDKKGPIAKVIRGAVIPFTRTPLNIAKTGLEYAPGTGLLTTIADVKKAPSNMKGNVAINGISKQITGTSLALLGYALAKQGILQSGEDEDKEGKFKKDQGLSMGFSIKLGDKFYDLSWLSPSSMPLFVGASMFEQLEKTDGINGDVIMEGIANTLDPLSEMSCISSFTDVLQSFQRGSSKMISQMGQKTAQNYISQFVPTVSSQFARLFDTKKRVTNADKTSSFKFGEETKNQLMYKIPGLRNLLPEQTDYFGETKEEEQNALVRGLEAFLSPANSKKDISTPEAQELLDLYNSTGDTDVLPSSLAKYLKYDGENINMSNKEWNDYKYNFGSTLKENLNELMGNYEYTDATPEQKAEMVSGLMKYSKDKAKDIFLESQGKEWEYTSDRVDAKRDGNFSVAEYYIIKNQAPKVFNGKAEDVQKKISAANDIGISLVDYYNIKSEINTLKADKDSNGKTISGSKKQKVVDYVNSLDYLDDEQKYGMLSSIYKKW